MRNQTVLLGCIALILTLSWIPREAGAQAPGSQKSGAANPASQSASSNQPAASSQSSPSSGGGASLQGISFAKASWENKLRKLPTTADLGIRHDSDIRVLCYTLVPGNSAVQPFILESNPISSPLWQANRLYKRGEVILPATLNGHYYKVQSAGRSDAKPPEFLVNGDTVKDGPNLSWQDMGSTQWTKRHKYEKDDIVVPTQPNGHYYQAQIAKADDSGRPYASAISGDNEPTFSDEKDGVVSDPSGEISWIDVGDLASAGPNKCDSVTPAKPLLMNQILVLAIDATGVPQDRFKILNLNLTNQQGAPLNPTPIRPSLSAATATGAEVSASYLAINSGAQRRPAQIYYLTWPNQLPGDTIATVSVNLIYTPVAPGLLWAPDTFYPAGSIVISKDVTASGATTNGHYYVALNSGISSDAQDTAAFDTAALAIPKLTEEGPGVRWKDMGDQIPNPPPASWSPTQRYPTGSSVVPVPPNGHYYQALNSAMTGATPPKFPTDGTNAFDPTGLPWKDKGLVTSLTPPAWQKSTPYAKGAQVTPSPANGHYYEAQKQGTSGATPPPFPVDDGTISDAGLSWKDKGLVNPIPPVWQPGLAFASGAQAIPNPANGHYYEAQETGVTGATQPPFRIDGGNVSEPSILVWLDAGSTQPATTKNLKVWNAQTPFFVGDVVQDVRSGHFYSVVQAGISGPELPAFSVPSPGQVPGTQGAAFPIQWQDLGASLPASVSAIGTTPADLTVNLLTYTLPQVHALSYFNIASGVVVSSIKSPTFLNTNLSTAATPNWIHTGPPTVDPILALSVYIKPMDAERLFQKSDLIPAPTLAFSLASPTTNFYVGASSELFFRNIQLTYGFSLAKVPSLDPASDQLSSTTPATRQVFAKGGFVGVSFNILGFIQSIF
jgi:hypothetical protein